MVQTLKFSSINSMHNCLKRGIGFTICPGVSVKKQILEKSLVKLDWEEDNFETSVIMIWHAEKWCSPLLKHFMTLSEEVMSG